MSKPIGYIRQQTVNCDFIVCQKHAQIDSMSLTSLTVDTLKSPTVDELEMRLLERISALETKVDALERANGPVYANGSAIASTLHLSDVDMNTEEFDLENFQTELRQTLANEAGVPIDQIVIIDLASTGSATARVEIRFPETVDSVQNEAIREQKDKFNVFLNNPAEVGEKFSGLGSVQMEEVKADLPILSINAKLFHLEQMLNGQEVVFDHAKGFTLDTYKFAVDGDDLRITRYDHNSSKYVGGTLVIDT